MNIICWIVIGLLAFNVIVFGLLALNDYLERKRKM